MSFKRSYIPEHPSYIRARHANCPKIYYSAPPPVPIPSIDYREREIMKLRALLDQKQREIRQKDNEIQALLNQNVKQKEMEQRDKLNQTKSNRINQSARWQCVIDNKQFAEFDPTVNDELNSLKIGGFLIHKRGKWKYRILKQSETEGVQINIETKKQRQIIKSNYSNIAVKLLETRYYKKSRKLSEIKIKNEFYKTCGIKIISIISIQHVESAKQSGCFEVILKDRCDALRKCRDEVVKYLWHGTNKDAVDPIIKNGFDRSYNNKNAYGNGTYFSTSAELSIRRKYAPMDDDGFCWLFFCKVIAGKYTKGAQINNKMMINDDGKEYDSYVNDELNPTIFSIWRDYAAVPMYLLKLKPHDKIHFIATI